MRSVLKWTIRLAIAFLSIDALIAVADYAGRWQWLEQIMADHPPIASIVRSPTFPLLCLGVALLAVYGDKYLKLPSVIARYTNSRIIPDLRTTTWKVIFDSDSKTPGWDLHEINWFWLVEVRLANESDTAITVEDVEVRVRVGGNKWLRGLFPFLRRTIPSKLVRDVGKFHTAPHGEQTDYKKVDGLVGKLQGMPLEKGHGHRGWICVSLKTNQRHMLDRPLLDIWLIDALYGRHALDYKKDDAKWDMSFEMLHDI